MKDGKTYGFTIADVDRLKRLLAWGEKVYRNDAPKRGKWPAPGWTGLRPSRSNASVAAGSIAAPTSFACTLLVPSGTAGALTATGGQVVTVLNPYATAIASGKLVWVTPFNGRLYVANADC